MVHLEPLAAATDGPGHAATFCAVGLILFFQHRALSTLESQTRVILREVAEQTANDIAVEGRKALDGPVFETLTGVNHPELRAGRLDLVAHRYKEGLATYPHVESFFVWSVETEAKVPGEALFYDRAVDGTARPAPALAPFTRHPALGQAIVALARRHAPEQRIYVAADTGGVVPQRQLLLRLFWTDANRDEYFAVLGYVVDSLHRWSAPFFGTPCPQHGRTSRTARWQCRPAAARNGRGRKVCVWSARNEAAGWTSCCRA